MVRQTDSCRAGKGNNNSRTKAANARAQFHSLSAAQRACNFKELAFTARESRYWSWPAVTICAGTAERFVTEWEGG